jgi:quercetin dioxygenase-like cupin family protein
MSVAEARELVPAIDGSALSLVDLRVSPGSELTIGVPDSDSLLYTFAGSGSLALDGDMHRLVAGAGALVLAGEEARLQSEDSELAVICATVGPEADRHAPLGHRELAVRLDEAGSEKATGARAFQILFGPHNGSTRATLFAGFIPPGRAPWHYHLYDEIVWVPAGPGRVHTGGTIDELEAGSTFRLRPRQAHIVENLSATDEMTVIGIFTPAGSPSAAYLTPEIAAEYRFSG